MLQKNKPFQDQIAGFTIVELLIASAVFSVVLLVVLTGFLQIGHIFYKGIANAQTQNAAKQVINDVSGSLESTSSDDFVQTGTSGAYTYYCIGNARYTFGVYSNNPNTSLNGLHTYYNSSSPENYDPYAAQPNMGVIKDFIPVEGACPVPCVSAVTDQAACTGTNFLALNTNNPQEVLGDHMRVTDFTIIKKTSALYDINVVVAYGSDDLLGYTSDTPPSPYCLGNSSDQRFCAVEQLSTSTQRGNRVR